MGFRAGRGVMANEITSAGDAQFFAQTGALLRARRQVSAVSRRDAGAAWWVSNLAVGLAACVAVAVAFLVGAGTGETENVDRAAASIVLFAHPFGAVLVLTFLNLHDAPEAHPLGHVRFLLPISFRRSSLLGVVERNASPSGIWVWAMGVVPWLGMAALGTSWLTPAGWASVAALPLFALASRELSLSVRRYIHGLLRDFIPSSGGVLLGIVWGLGVFLLLGILPGRLPSVTSSPVLQLANHPVAPAGILVATAGFLVAAVAIPPSRTPRWMVWRRPSLRFLTGPRASFSAGRREFVLLKMLLVTATRQASYRYSAGAVILLSVVTMAFPGFGAGWLVLIAYVAPASSFYNLYGPDSRHYCAILATGSSLAEWTRARLMFSSIHLGTFGIVLGAVVLISGYLPPRTAFTLLAPIPLAAAVGWLVGPRVSRFVMTSVGPRGDGSSPGTFGSRRWVTWLMAVVVYMVCGPFANMPLATSAWWLYPVPMAVPAIVWLVMRPDRRAWDPALRSRLAAAFV